MQVAACRLIPYKNVPFYVWHSLICLYETGIQYHLCAELNIQAYQERHRFEL